jgi:hypothetical protein
VLGLCAVWLAGGRVIVHEKDRFASQVEEFIARLADITLPAQDIAELLIELTDRKPATREEGSATLRIA